jgi:protein-tyrosine phosphatase
MENWSLSDVRRPAATAGDTPSCGDARQNTVLFLCTGNYYRSRFAELLFNWHADERKLAWRADSRGLDPDPANDGPISRHTLRALARLKIAVPAELRFPLRATRADFERCQHIVAVKEAEHRPLLARFFPEVLERVEFWHVHDLDFADPEEAIPQLERLVCELVGRLAARGI